MNRTRTHSLLLPLILSALLGCEERRVSDDTLKKARTLTESYQESLKATLVQALKDGGPTQAIQVCNLEAPKIAERVEQKGQTRTFRVSRTATRFRNPRNKPSSLEERGLKELEQSLAAGKSPETLEWHELRGNDFVYMRPIMMGGVCTTCHGPKESLAPALKSELARLYPDDRATGFSVGELRGAFVVTGPMSD